MSRAARQAVWALVHWSLWTTRRHPFLLLGEIVRPFFWLVFVSLGMSVLGSGSGTGTGGHGSAPGFVFAGVLVLTILQTGLRRSSFLVEERKVGFLRALALAPASSFTLVVGIVASHTLVVTAQALLFTLFAGMIVLGRPAGTLAPLAATIALVGVGTVASGLWLASLPFRPAAFRTVVGIVTLPGYFLSGGVIPFERTPGWLAPVIRANPFTYGVDLARHAMGLRASFPLAVDLVCTSAFALAMTALAGIVFHRRLFDLRPLRSGRHGAASPQGPRAREAAIDPCPAPTSEVAA